jgi:tetratricopeptide (TPR) repeat protein
MSDESKSPPQGVLVVLVALGLVMLAPITLDSWRAHETRQQSEGWVQLHRARAAAALSQERYDLAESTYEQAMSYAPNSIDLRLELFDVRLARVAAQPRSVTRERLGDLAYMLDMSKAARDRTADANWLVARGLLAERREDANRATVLYEQATEANPGAVYAHLAIARLKRAAGDLPGARAAHQAAHQATPNNLEALNNLGTVEVELGSVESGLGRFVGAIAIRDNGVSRVNAANALSLLDRNKEAIVHLAKAHEMAPGSAEILRRLGHALALDQQAKVATQVLERSLALEDSAVVRLKLGQLALEMQDGDRALQIFSELLEADPNGLNPLFEFGRTLKGMGRLDEASVVLTRYVQLAQARPDQAERVALVKRAFAPPGAPGAIPEAEQAAP